jgi:hypothetical protein
VAADGGLTLKAEAAWWRAEHNRLGRELEHMTPGHAAAIGPAAVRRMQVDHETALQLAREAEQRLAMLHPELVDDQAAVDGPTLF